MRSSEKDIAPVPQAPLLVLRGLINPIVSSGWWLLFGVASMGGVAEVNPIPFLDEWVVISGIAVLLVVYLARCTQLRVTASPTELRQHGHFRTRTIRLCDVERVNVEPYEGWLTSGYTNPFWMPELTLKSDDPAKMGRPIELPVLAAKKTTADRMEARLREHLRLHEQGDLS